MARFQSGGVGTGEGWGGVNFCKILLNFAMFCYIFCCNTVRIYTKSVCLSISANFRSLLIFGAKLQSVLSGASFLPVPVAFFHVFFDALTGIYRGHTR